MAITDLLECTIDFEGQRLADSLAWYLVVVAAVIGVIAGYALQNLQITLSIFLVGMLATVVIVFPPWPMYNRNPQKWLQKK